MRSSILLVSTALLAIGVPGHAQAAEAAETAAAGSDGPIVVTGQREQYGAKSTSTATKTPTDIKDIPQALTVITERQIEDQSLRSISDVMLYVPGASFGSGESNRDTIVLRGNSSTADFFVDGVRDDVQYFRDFYNAERIEVLRGSNAMIFGRGGGGGIVNRVTKTSNLNQYREFAASGDSEGGVRLTGDLDQPLSASLGLRLNGVYENGSSFRRHVDLERYGFNPVLGAKLGSRTRVDLSYEYFHDRRTTDRGVPADGSAPLKGFNRTFFGDPDQSYAKADVNVGTLTLEHELSDALTLRSRTLVGDYDKFYQNIYPTGLAAPVGAEVGRRVLLGAYNSRNHRRNGFSQTDLIWTNRLAGIDQALLLGFEIGRQKSRNFRQTGRFAPGANRVPLSDPTVDVNVVYANSATDANNRVRATVAAVYVQDQIRISPMFEIVAGLRLDSFKLDVNDFHGVGAQFSRKDNLVSPRLGLIFKPVPTVSLYANYGRSYLPQSGDQFGSLNPTTQSLKPERFDNYELGAKWEPIPGLLATAAIYRLDRTNTRATDPVTLLTVPTGAQRSRGLEIGLERSISDRWQISAGYAWQKAEITEATTAAPAGRQVPLVPRHTFSLWSRYDVTGGLGLGLGVVARSKSYASISNAVKLPGYTRVDAALFYKFAKGMEAQLNVENIFDANYFATSNGDNNLAPGAPTTARATLRFNF
ncbi:MAG: TonB-dependent siderophore receptor [Sphingomicrobium sp.]